MIFWLTPFIFVENWTNPLPNIVKMKSLSAERPVFSEFYRIYEVNRDLSIKQ